MLEPLGGKEKMLIRQAVDKYFPKIGKRDKTLLLLTEVLKILNKQL